ncbi:hypothetical protein COV11_04170 [Candidatus Woesearchaeota archaeon CG10_big_fil_rev_8_21_14_0_10_30_7]|nr:MAG: hypothetical protein COV11_04170 [Candidatus Woesearchaeota archaeon CG10_big_fil_rev_8_21_14_0_10_30_7]
MIKNSTDFLELERNIINDLVDDFASETGLFFDPKVKDKIFNYISFLREDSKTYVREVREIAEFFFNYELTLLRR